MAENSTAFDSANPPLKITNPGGSKTFQEYPRHLHDAGGNFITVENDADKAARLAEGWHLTVADAAMAALEAADGAVLDAEAAKTEAAASEDKSKRGKAAKTEAAA